MVETTVEERKNLKILVVDDEIQVLEVLQSLLDTEGYVTRGAGSGAAALEMIREAPPHIVFLDIKMQEMDGLECLKKIREAEPNTVVVMMSGIATLDMAKKSLEFGAFDYIEKPFNFEHIREVIQQIFITHFMDVI
jgi:DNA-binding NtrC family response regulator